MLYLYWFNLPILGVSDLQHRQNSVDLGAGFQETLALHHGAVAAKFDPGVTRIRRGPVAVATGGDWTLGMHPHQKWLVNKCYFVQLYEIIIIIYMIFTRIIT